MEKLDFEIEGGRKLGGEVSVNTSKNAAVAFVVASLLNKGETTIKNIAKIEEVNRHLEVLSSIGVKISWRGEDLVLAPPKKFSLSKLDKEAAQKTRSILLYLGALIHDLKDFKLPAPGGCKLGSRTVKPHIYALEELGVKIKQVGDNYEIGARNLKARHITMYEASDTATINALFAASKIPGKTLITFASANYQVQDTCYLLEKFGVKIEGIGTTTLLVQGVKDINKNVSVYPSEDPTDAMFFISLAVSSKSEIKVKRAPIDFLELELYKLEKMGLKYKLSKPYKAKNGKTNLVDISLKASELRAVDDKIESRPYPGVNIDNLPFFVPIATQAKGKTLIHDWVYENRAIYYMELVKLGAKMKLPDPHRLFVDGPRKLKPADISCPPALRPSAIILIAMLVAKGKSRLHNVYSILRGYEGLEERLSALGAKIKTVKQS